MGSLPLPPLAFLERAAGAFGGRTAVVDEGCELTYAELAGGPSVTARRLPRLLARCRRP